MALVPSGKPPVDMSTFQAVSLLGRGAFAEVLLVYDKVTRMNFAMKRVSLKPNPDRPRQYEFVANEKQAMERLGRRPWFAHCYFTALTARHACFCMKYYPGGTLHDLISRKMGNLSFRDAQALVAEMLMAVKKLHGRNVLHRDIHPNNFFFDADGHIVIADFGLSVALSKSVPREERVVREFLEHLQVPEMQANPPKYSFPADVFSLGVTICSLCSQENQSYSWTREQKRDSIDLQDAMLTRCPEKRATLKAAAKSRFFAGVRWKDVEEKKLDMAKFGRPHPYPILPDNSCEVDLGITATRPPISATLWNFESYQAYSELRKNTEDMSEEGC